MYDILTVEIIIYIAVVILGVITAAIISQNKSNRAFNIYLIILLYIISFRFLFVIMTKFNENFAPLLSLNHFFSLLIPIVYLYFKNLVNDFKKIKKKDIIHIIFPLFLGGLNVINNKFNFFEISSELILRIVIVVYLFIYVLKIFILLKNSIWKRNSKIIIINQQNELILNWSIFLFIIIFLAAIRLSTSIFIDIINGDYTSRKNELWLSGILFIILFIKILSTPEILFGYNALYKKINLNKASLLLNYIWLLNDKKEIKNQQDALLKDKIYPNLIGCIKNIERLAIEEKVFRNQKITKIEIAKKLELPKSHLKYIFKYHSKINYTEFKKMIKIHDALQLIETGYLKLNTLEGLAIKVGFASYNPFFTSFKEITGTTPQAYNKEFLSDRKQITGDI